MKLLLIPGELFGALRGRLYDSNKNIVMATLTTIGNVASAMGQAVEKSSKVSGFCCFEFSSQSGIVAFLAFLKSFKSQTYLKWFIAGYSV